MNHPTYEQQWQKITSAYLNNELNPLNNCACFIGNLLNGSCEWRSAICSYTGEETGRDWDSDNFFYTLAAKFIYDNNYTPQEIGRMEHNFLSIISNGVGRTVVDYCDSNVLRDKHSRYEESLFTAMVTTLEILRQIHLAKGDETAQPITLQKRTLCAAQ